MAPDYNLRSKMSASSPAGESPREMSPDSASSQSSSSSAPEAHVNVPTIDALNALNALNAIQNALATVQSTINSSVADFKNLSERIEDIERTVVDMDKGVAHVEDVSSKTRKDLLATRDQIRGLGLRLTGGNGMFEKMRRGIRNDVRTEFEAFEAFEAAEVMGGLADMQLQQDIVRNTQAELQASLEARRERDLLSSRVLACAVTVAVLGIVAWLLQTFWFSTA
ncbi:hypothetical protein F5Y13DRAFT_188667 [Hypoxylon sp. FL1857]|nr:hypothetical protein F5Y13DRAFT_188667 [Hypoxylon sp. FL1857]